MKFFAPGDPKGVDVVEVDASVGVAISESILDKRWSSFCSISLSSSGESK